MRTHVRTYVCVSARSGYEISGAAGAAGDAVRAGKLVAPDRFPSYLDLVAVRRNSDGRSIASDLFELAGVHRRGGAMAERYRAGREGYGDWRPLELAIKGRREAVRWPGGAGRQRGQRRRADPAGPLRRFLSRAFADGDRSEWLLKSGISMLARVPRSRTTKGLDLVALRAPDLADAERGLVTLAEADLGDHLTFHLIRSTPTGLGDMDPGQEQPDDSPAGP